MRLLTQLRTICDPMPPGSSVTLPVDWLRPLLQSEEAAGAAAAPQPEADLTVKEVAAIVGRKEGAVRQWIRSGAKGTRLRAYTFNGREYRITRAALTEFLEAKRNGSVTPAPAKRGRAADLGSWRKVQRAS